jgi:hypothetical protein
MIADPTPLVVATAVISAGLTLWFAFFLGRKRWGPFIMFYLALTLALDNIRLSLHTHFHCDDFDFYSFWGVITKFLVLSALTVIAVLIAADRLVIKVNIDKKE